MEEEIAGVAEWVVGDEGGREMVCERRDDIYVEA